MSYKRYLITLKGLVKSRREVLFICFAAVVVLPTLINLSSLWRSNASIAQGFSAFSQWFVPYCSIFASVYLLKDFTDSPGNELLYFGNTRLLPLSLTAMLLYCLLNGVVYGAFDCFSDDNIKGEYARILIEILFFSGLTFFTLCVSGSSTAALAVSTGYAIFQIIQDVDGSRGNRLAMLNGNPVKKGWFLDYLPFLVAGVIFYALGHMINRRYVRYR